jgi:MFS family permease
MLRSLIQAGCERKQSMADYFSTLRRFNRNIRLYILAWGLIGFGFFGIQGVLFNLYLLRLGYDARFIGLFSSVGLLVWALCTLPAGAAGKMIGNRNAFIGGMLISMGANAMVLMVEAVPAHLRVAWLVAWWVMRWTGTALATVNGTPYLTGITDTGNRKHAFSSQQAALAVSAFLGSLAAGFLPGLAAGSMGQTLDAAAPYRAVLWLTPLFYAAAIGLLLRTDAERTVERTVDSSAMGKKPVAFMVLMGVVVFLYMIGEGTVRTFFNIYMDSGLQVSTAFIGTLMGVGQLLPIVAAMVAPVLMVKWGAGRTLTVSIVGLAASLLVLAVIPHWLGASSAYIGVAAMASIFGPARNVFSQEAVAPAWRTAISTATTMGVALGWAAAAWTGGSLLSILGYSGLFTLGAMLATMSAVLLQSYLRRRSSEGLGPIDVSPAVEG